MFIKNTDFILISNRFLFTLFLSGLLLGNSPPKKSVIKLATLAPSGTEWHGMLMKMGQQWEQETEGAVQLCKIQDKELNIYKLLTTFSLRYEKVACF